jgi:histidinol phosphatase-like PHP family hydrolase
VAHAAHASVSDINGAVGGLLRDLAYVQSAQPQMFGYKRAAAAILALETPLAELMTPAGRLQKIPHIGPGSTRVIREVLETGGSSTVEGAIDASGRRADIERRRRLRAHFLSRAEVLRILGDPRLGGPSAEIYQGDLQMHTEWSDGSPTVAEIARACQTRGYTYAAVTDHSHGLRIAGGMSMREAAGQRLAIDRVNAETHGFRLLQGIEANIGADGQLDLSPEESSVFEVVLAAPHSRLRRSEDQTPRLVTAVENPAVRILAHPRGRITDSRAGIVADWDIVFRAAARVGVAIEIDGDPSRQDVDYTLAASAHAAGCMFALDSDAHAIGQLAYVETALAHARLAGIPADRIVNCWPLERLLAWLGEPARERRGGRVEDSRVAR